MSPSSPDDPVNEIGLSPAEDSGLEHGPFLLHRNKGREHFEAQEFEKARRNLELAHRIRPDDAEVLYWLAMACFRLDQHEVAEGLFHRLIEAKPGVAALHVNRGIVLYKMNRMDEAEAEFRGALDLDENANRPHLYLGLLDARRGDYRSALEHFQRSGAEILAARMKARMRSSKPRWSGARLTPPPARAHDRAAELDVPPAPAEPPPPASPEPSPAAFADAMGAEAAGRPVRGEAVFTPHGRYLVEVEFSDELLVRRGALAGCVGSLSFDVPGDEGDLLRVRGTGRVILVGEGRRLSVAELVGEMPFYLEIGHFVACERRVRRELVALGRREGLGLRVVALHGKGIVTMATGGKPIVIEVRPDRPVSVAADLLVGWSGDLEPALVRQGGMEDLAIRGSGGALKLRFLGEGRLLLDHRREDGL